MHPVALKILEFCREYKLRVGYSIPAKPFTMVLFQSLNPREQDQVDQALDELRADGYLEDEKLTEKGFNLIYGEEFSSQRAPAAMSQTFNFNGTGHNIQIGDNNTQQIINAMTTLAKAINDAEVPDVEKQEAKGVLRSLLENPTVLALIGPAIEGVKGLLS